MEEGCITIDFNGARSQYRIENEYTSTMHNRGVVTNGGYKGGYKKIPIDSPCLSRSEHIFHLIESVVLHSCYPFF